VEWKMQNDSDGQHVRPAVYICTSLCYDVGTQPLFLTLTLKTYSNPNPIYLAEPY